MTPDQTFASLTHKVGHRHPDPYEHLVLQKGYIAGPMTGYPNYNFGAFFSAEARLQLYFDYEVDLVNPARHDEEMGWVEVVRDEFGGILSATKRESNGFSWAEALDWDLEQIATCDFIYLLPGWTKSRGACKEFEFARARGIDIRGATAEQTAVIRSEPLVGLIGYARCGKDTFAAALGYERLAFADPLKQLAVYVNPLVETLGGGLVPLESLVTQVGWDKAKEVGVNSPQGTRPFLQDLGVGVRKFVKDTAWVEAALAKYDPSRPTVVTDVRFENEVAAIRDRGGLIVRITRDTLKPPNGHISEQLVETIEPDFDIRAPYLGIDSLREQAAALDAQLRPGAR